MMGSTRTGAATAASAAGSRRTGAGTIGEAAAIAARRAAATETAEAVSAPAPVAPPPDEREDHPAASPGHGAAHPDAEPPGAQPAAEPIPLRRTRAGAGQIKELPQALDRTAVHLILAGRAYAYGQRIVRKEEAQKPGDVVAIES
jgi:hypothetical protein